MPVVSYIENNPVKAGLAPRAGDYRWSSAAEPDWSAETPGMGPQTGSLGASRSQPRSHKKTETPEGAPV